MNVQKFLKQTFGNSLFSHLKSNEILEERIKCEKKIERISDDIKRIQDKIQKLMIESKGQERSLKLLNVQKIKALRLESITKQREASVFLKHMQLLLLLEAMKEHHKTEDKNKFIEKILKTDIDELSEVLFDEDVKQSIKEGRIEDVKERLKRTFAKEEIPIDKESQEILSAIDDLEGVDEETAMQMAEEHSKKIIEKSKKEEELE